MLGLSCWGTVSGNSICGRYDPDGPLPEEVERHGTNAGQTAFRQIVDWARNENLTIRQLYQRFAGARGQRTVIGTASTIADDMQTWFDSYAVDGFLDPAFNIAGWVERLRGAGHAGIAEPGSVPRGVRRSDFAG
jgi:alkanesulfonate monooxygenase SsuD/methylene tetrahydromethanopterin reductase-like flavin-dependent oxidoreductase (luciferase family)